MQNSGFQLVNGLIGAAKPSAELAAETRQQLDGDGRRLFRKFGEFLVAERVAYDIVIGDDGGGARSSVENGEFAEYGARRECREAYIAAVGLTEIGAGAALGDDKKRIARIAFTENDFAAGKGFAPRVASYDLEFRVDLLSSLSAAELEIIGRHTRRSTTTAGRRGRAG